ncbi:hypothetical protein V6245_06150 [Salinibacterium amurskyense]|uniref:hypothetical protein n=1 Tax=Salinibacterium amurskyense TaxID=205941 RepID=UPI00311FF05C
MIEWLTFGTTVLLLGVTAWYAVLTRSLAQSARESALNAQVAAEHSAKSAAATVANLKVEFDASPSYWFSANSGLALGVRLVCAGATVFVHEARILEAYRSVANDEHGGEFESLFIYDEGVQMAADVGLPSRLHGGEAISFQMEPAYILDENVGVAELRVRVRYSLEGTGDGIVREIEWHGTRGTDFE